MRTALFVLFAAAQLLPTGATLDPVAPVHRVGDFPLAAAVAPDGNHVALLLCGWRQQGVQIVDRATGAVTQTLEQPSAFVGLVFSADGKRLYASGGNEDAIFVYRWDGDRLTADGSIVLGGDPKHKGMLYPAGLALSSDGKQLIVAENLSDTIAVIDTATRHVTQRLRSGLYPYGVVADAHGNIFVSAWGEDSVDVYRRGTSGYRHAARVAPGRHPSAMVVRGERLYVASATTDTIAVVSTQSKTIVKTLTDAAPSSPREGSSPNALALSADGKRLFVAEGGNNAVAVFETASGKLLGRVPAEFYPSALAVSGGDVIVVNAKGSGSAPNPNLPKPNEKVPPTSRDFTLGQLDGSVMTFRAAALASDLHDWSARVAKANGWDRTRSTTAYPPFKHVVYVIKENRTYDQVFGDMSEGDGERSLVFFDESVTPNHHALARRFGLYDRFFVNADVSAEGHNWSTAAYSSDYVEKTVPLSSRWGDGRPYDYEGFNRNRIVDDDDDVAGPSTGYLWDLALKKKISLRNYGEYVYGVAAMDSKSPQSATKRTLDAVSNLDFAGFDMGVKDQARMDVWEREFAQYVARGTMPTLEIVRLPNDHTSGASANRPTPRAAVADNDLALGRLIESLSSSPFWRDTVVFVLEDDAQNGPDHVDSHRSLLLTISAWNRGGTIHRFVNTTDVVATIEDILGLGAMSSYDRYGRVLRGVFASQPDLTPYHAVKPAIDLNEKNPPAPPKTSQLLDFSRPDAVDDATFNRILWSILKGSAPYPGARRATVGEMTR